MAYNNIEIEIHVNVENQKPLMDFLKKEAIFISENHQVDEYYSPAHKNYLDSRPTAEWLSLRDSDGKYSINYKNWKFDDASKSHFCDEIETKVESI